MNGLCIPKNVHVFDFVHVSGWLLFIISSLFLITFYRYFWYSSRIIQTCLLFDSYSSQKCYEVKYFLKIKLKNCNSDLYLLINAFLLKAKVDTYISKYSNSSIYVAVGSKKRRCKSKRCNTVIRQAFLLIQYSFICKQYFFCSDREHQYFFDRW